MNILHVNNVDLSGRRYNGYDLIQELSDYGISCKQAVLTKLSDNSDVVSLFTSRSDAYIHNALCRIEERHSMNNLLYPWGRVLARSAEFEWADIVHYHVIHNQVLSVFDLPSLFKQKPSIWTFHDPWPMTGHCVHPQGCGKWLTGCANCPSLDSLFAMRDDCAHRMWKVKERVLSQLDVDIVVASEYMLDMVTRSPLTRHFKKVHSIPFGIQTELFLPEEEKAASRKMLGIPPDDFVIFFRSTEWELKGLKHIIEALSIRPPTRPTTLLTVDVRGLLAGLAPAYGILDMGWVHDPVLYSKILSACDVFLMPSAAESFGLMAVEAMAAGRPVICFEGTAVPSVTHAPECGIAVPPNAQALRDAIDLLAENPREAQRRGEIGRVLAATEYDRSRYLDDMAALYRSVLTRTNSQS